MRMPSAHEHMNRRGHMRKKTAIMLTAAALLLEPARALAAELTSQAACVIDAETGKTYYELASATPLAPASMTKVMTVYLIYEQMSKGLLSKNTMITADAQDEFASADEEATNVPLIAGTAYSVDELIGAILIPSACAASAMAGKYISGSEAAFAALMNKTAAELGLNAYYEDASGLSDNNRITAHSMAELARILINKYPDVLTYTSKPYIEFRGERYDNTNRLLPGEDCEYPGADGLKTGTTTLAGCCLTATAYDGEVRLISVTMDSDYGTSRFDDSAELLNIGFEQAHRDRDNVLYTDMRLFINGSEIPSLVYAGPNEGICFILEDLKDYGFNISWDPSSMTVSAKEAPGKEIAPIPTDIYRSSPPGTVFAPIVKGSALSADISVNGTEYTFEHVYPLNGYTAVPADELSAIAESSIWNSAEKRLDIRL